MNYSNVLEIFFIQIQQVFIKNSRSSYIINNIKLNLLIIDNEIIIYVYLKIYNNIIIFNNM